MGSSTKIEWTQGSDGSAGATWTPIRARNVETGKVGWHCEHVTSGCENCYSEAINRRLGTGLRFRRQDRGAIEISLDEDLLANPLRWRRPRKIFVCSMTDLFAEFVTDDMIDRVFAVMALCPQHIFQVLTKRAERMRDYLANRSKPDDVGFPAEDIRVVVTAWAATPSRRAAWPILKKIPFGKFCQQVAWPLPNVWLGVSVEDQARADEHIPLLLETPATVRFLSCEPLLEELNLSRYFHLRPAGAPSCDWTIVGGESGPLARPFHLSWGASLVEECRLSGSAVFVKQLGSNAYDDISYEGSTPRFHTRNRKGGDIAEFPKVLMVREFPT